MSHKGIQFVDYEKHFKTDLHEDNRIFKKCQDKFHAKAYQDC